MCCLLQWEENFLQSILVPVWGALAWGTAGKKSPFGTAFWYAGLAALIPIMLHFCAPTRVLGTPQRTQNPKFLRVCVKLRYELNKYFFSHRLMPDNVGGC